jgi:hypothetical protein
MKKLILALGISATIFSVFIFANSCSKLGEGQLAALLRSSKPNVTDCPPGYHWDFEHGGCVPDDPACADGYHWDPDYGGCIPDCPLGYHNAPPDGACVVDAPEPYFSCHKSK